MPTYEYKCKDCGETMEVVQSFSEDSLTVCPTCDGELRKVFSAAGIIFKGSGWHVKDYASKGGSTTSAPSSSGEEGSSGSSEGSGTTTKSDATSSDSGSSSSSADSTTSSTSSTPSTSSDD